MVCGTLPWNSSVMTRPAPWIDFALLRKKPVVRISSSNSGREAAAIALGVGKALKSAGVTRLTRTSVHWADKIVATRSCHALLWWRAQTALG